MLAAGTRGFPGISPRAESIDERAVYRLPLSCRSFRLSRLLLIGRLGFDEGGDPVVQLIDPVEATMAAGDDSDLRVLHAACPVAGLRSSVIGGHSSGEQAQAVIDYHLRRLFPASRPALGRARKHG